MSTLKIDFNDDVEMLKAYHVAIGEVIKLKGKVHKVDLANTDRMQVVHNPDVANTGPAADINAGEHLDGDFTPEQIDATGPTTDKRVDTNGVVFNPEFCGVAAKPFYSSGKREGQWKKRQGVSDDKYDAWYTEMLVMVGPDDNTDVEPETVDTASAFGGQVEQPAAEPIPEDCGSFMGWLSVHQAAGKITQEDIGNAYVSASVSMTDIFPPTAPETVKQNIAKLYGILAQKVNG